MSDTVEEHREAQAQEYGRYVAAEPIYIGGARAFNEGDPVPVSHVEREVVSADQVTDTTKKPAAKPATPATVKES